MHTWPRSSAARPAPATPMCARPLPRRQREAQPMKPAIQFLHSLSQALSASTLYAGTHPARRRAVRASDDALRILQSHDDTPAFSFLGRDVIYGFDILRDLRDWEWSTRLAALGIQRIEIVADVTIEDFEIFIDEVHVRLTTPVAAAAAAAAAPASPTAPAADRSRQAAIRYGTIGIQGAARDGISGAGLQEVPFTLQEEAAAVRFIHAEVADKGTVPMVEAEA